MYPQSYGQIPQDDPDCVTESSPNVSAMENLDAADPVSFNDLTEESIMRQLSEVLPYDDPQLLEALSLLNGHGNELFHASPVTAAVTLADDQPMVVPVGWSPMSSGAESFDELAIGASTSRNGVEISTSSPQSLGDMTFGLQPVNPSCSSWSVSTSFAAGCYSPPAASTCGRVLPSLRKEGAVNVTAVSSSTVAAAGVGSGNAAWMASHTASSSRFSSSSSSTSDYDNQAAAAGVPDPRESSRKERRREQNRRAALKCRTRRKQALNDMEKNFVELSNQRQQNANRISWLMAQIADMERTLVSHEQSCHCTLRNNNNNNNNSSTSGS